MLQPKIKILSQDTEGYASVTLQDDTGAYNVTTNPGGYGAPNPATGDIVKTFVRETYMGDSAPGAWEEVPKAEIQGAGTVWTHDFREGVTEIGYLAGIDLIGGGVTALKGNVTFSLTNAHIKLEGCSHIEINGVLYQLDTTKLTSTGGEVKTAFDADYPSVAANIYYEGSVYSLWNAQGYKQLVQDIATMACTTLECETAENAALLKRWRYYQATGYNFEKGNYSKAHNLAVLLSPELTTSNCASC